MKILRIAISIIVLPFVIIGYLIYFIGCFLSALSYVFWFEPKTFFYELRNLYKDMKTWIK